MVTAMGVSMGLTVGRDHEQGHDRAEGALGARPADAGEDRRVGDHRAGLGLRRLRRDAVDGARATATSTCSTDQDVHHQRARTPTPSCSSASSTRATRRERKVLSFVLDKGMPGLEQSKPLRKMGMHSSPTGELFLTDVRVGTRPPHRRDRGRAVAAAAKAPRTRSRRSAPASRRWRSASSSSASSCRVALRQGPRAVRQAHRRVPADPAQARPDGGRSPQRAEPGVPPHRDVGAPASGLTLAEASAMKLYSARGRDRGGPGGGAALRRQRLHGRVPASSSSPATPRSSRSTPAPTRSRSPTSPRTSSAATDGSRRHRRRGPASGRRSPS